MSKPKEIVELEQAYGIELKESEFGIDEINSYFFYENGLVKKLNLANNKITNSKPLQKLNNVFELNIRGNYIDDISFLSSFKNLTKLNISDNSIKTIEPLFNCKELDKLIVNGNIENFNTQIQNLTQLNDLSIEGGDNLDQINFEKFYKLQSLSISNTKVFDLHCLSKNLILTSLSFGNCVLENFELISKHTNLTIFSTYFVKITSLKPLKKLKSLRYLFLHDNQLENIQGIEDLNNLNLLFVTNNLLSNLDPIKQLLIRPDVIYEFSGNKLPEELQKKLEIKDKQEKIDALKIYYDNLYLGDKPLNEAKLMILGEGEAGKSNLRNYLLGNAFNDSSSATVGIEIDKWQLKNDGTDYRINVWDFGGQWLQQQIHKFFITNESVYVILLKPRTDDKPDIWLDWIKVYAPNSKAIIVVNRMDDLNGQSFSLTENTIKENYPFVIGFHYISLREACLRNNTEAKLLVNNLRESIETALLDLPNLKTPTAKNIFNLKTELEDKIFSNRPFIGLDYFEELVKQHKIVGDVGSILQILNRVGTLRYFPKTYRYVLNPEWLSAGVYKLITSSRTEQLKGVVTEADFPILLQKTEKDKFEYKETDYSYLREMMDTFNLAYIDANTKTCFIPKQFEKDIPNFLVNEKLFEADYIHYYFQYEGYFPDSLISQFIAEKYDKLYKNYYWQQGIVLEDIDEDYGTTSLAYVKADANKKRIEIKVKGEDKRAFFKEIKQTLKDLQKEANFNYKEFIVDVENNLTIEYNKLLVRFKNNKTSYDEVTDDGKELTIDITKVLGHLQLPRETVKEVSTTINNTYNIQGDYHHKGMHYNNQFNFYDYAPNYTELLTELEKANKTLSINEQAELNTIITELDAIPQEKNVEKSKSLFQKALDRIMNFEKTINDETQKEAAKAVIRNAWNGLTELFNSIPWENAALKTTSYLEKGMDYLRNL